MKMIVRAGVCRLCVIIIHSRISQSLLRLPVMAYDRLGWFDSVPQL